MNFNLPGIQKEYSAKLNGLQGGEDMDSFEIVSTRELKFLYFDNSHFTKQGSRDHGEKMQREYPYQFDMETMKEVFPVDKQYELSSKMNFRKKQITQTVSP